MTRHKYKYLSLSLIAILSLIANALGAYPIAVVGAFWLISGGIALWVLEMIDLFRKPK